MLTMKPLLILATLALTLARAGAAESYRMLSTSAARDTNAVVCLLSWDATPPEFEVVSYSIYQADAVEGPYTLIASSDTNEMLLVVELGTHFWNVRAISIWNGAPLTSEASSSVGMVQSAPGGVGVKKVHPKRNESLPPEVLVPIAPPMTNAPFTRARIVPKRRPAPFNNPGNLPTE
jgi:hypothetical protein